MKLPVFHVASLAMVFVGAAVIPVTSAAAAVKAKGAPSSPTPSPTAQHAAGAFAAHSIIFCNHHRSFRVSVWHFLTRTLNLCACHA